MKKIKDFITSIFQPDVFATFLNYTVKVFLNPIIVFFVPIFLSENQQGYWYTFGSIAALTTFADLGFTSIMTQYVAHEYTYLELDKSGKTFIGPEQHIERMSSLYRFIVRWMGTVLSFALAIIFFVGYIMFSENSDGVKWFIPWILYTLSSVYNFSSQVALSFFEGCDQFAVTQKIRTFSSILHCTATIGLLAAGTGLYALAVPLFLKGSLVFLLLRKYFGTSLAQLWNEKITEEVAWRKEFVPLLGKYAVSWASGYFASQIYNPLTFSLFGSGAAGKVGYSLSIVQAIYSVSNAWSLISIPKYNMAVEKREWSYMDSLLKRNLIYSSVIYFIGVSVFYMTQSIPLMAGLIWSRIVSGESMVVLCGAYYISVVSYALSTYLRAHKQEPYMIVSVLLGGSSALLTYIFTRYMGLNFIFIGLLVSNVLVLPMAIFIWKQFRVKWHTEAHKGDKNEIIDRSSLL